MAIDELPNSNLCVCYSSDDRDISRLMADFLTQQNGDATKTLFFVSAIDRFPVAEFCELLPPQEHAALFENVRVLTSLDMDEFTSTVGQISRSVFAARSALQRSETCHNSAPNGFQTLILVHGLDVIFRNTALKDQQHAHRSLKDIMLRLRMLGNVDDFGTRTILLFPPRQAPPPPLSHDNQQSSHLPLQKRHKSSGGPFFQNYNSLSAYVMKFYADSVIDIAT
ncbi:Csm2p LALA0_S04e08570g [Lachancea lanzarotensis]|uniref:LALA0S04e08570g1_1 n=1 Tax=Lachancea lanzarotensis TaxID=1245769 RepID=A0A0C7N2D4_9SACH|nr:uncharacterized protein LALA0_S04e08570g [Lachancea lanzarotensis]CEP62132.1 LALA0S04e08570g1_1 [Lachancea lanzarotensis]